MDGEPVFIDLTGDSGELENDKSLDIDASDLGESDASDLDESTASGNVGESSQRGVCRMRLK